MAQDLLATEDPESGSLVHFHMLQRPLQGRSSLGVGCLLFVHLKVSNVQHTHCIFFEHTATKLLWPCVAKPDATHLLLQGLLNCIVWQ